MNKTMLRGKWHQTRGGLMAEWGRLTENDQRMIEGRMEQMLGMLQERYGYTRARATAALEHYLGFHAKKGPALPAVPRPGRFTIGSAIGLAMLGAIGWFTFAKFFAGEQPPVFEDKKVKTNDWALDEYEAVDFENELMGYEAALD